MGGGSSVPASTTSTTTVNQSPWQNPTYAALMLGSSGNPGPVTSMLNYDQGMMNAYNDLINRGVTPSDIVNSGIYNPTMYPGALPTVAGVSAPYQTGAGASIPLPSASNLPGKADGGTIDHAAVQRMVDMAAAAKGGR